MSWNDEKKKSRNATGTYLTQRSGVAKRADALEVADQIDAFAPVAAGEVCALVDVGTAVTTCCCCWRKKKIEIKLRLGLAYFES